MQACLQVRYSAAVVRAPGIIYSLYSVISTVQTKLLMFSSKLPVHGIPVTCSFLWDSAYSPVWLIFRVIGFTGNQKSDSKLLLPVRKKRLISPSWCIDFPWVSHIPVCQAKTIEACLSVY